ncbi:MAG: CRISPR-associated helicase Cas3' [Isosphaeraceae bacterium]
MTEHLMAKSGKPVRDEMTLTGHTSSVLRAVDGLFVTDGGPSRLAQSWLQFFGLAILDFPLFLRCLRIAAAAHDWGKANDGFQAAIHKSGDQVIRHEHLSGLLLFHDATPDWLRRSQLDWTVILSAVISHHVKSGQKTLGELLPGARTTVKILSDHQDFAEIWKMIQAEVGFPCPANIKFPNRWREEDIKQRSQSLRTALNQEKSRLRDDSTRRKWLAAVRSGLIVADAVGSAVTRLPDELEAWIVDSFSPILTGTDIQEKIIDRRIAELRSRGRWDDLKGFSKFQRDIAKQGSRVLLTAPCGSGKTLAAWNWIKARLDEHLAARVLFLYPTRATATEGFRDYVSWAPEDEAGLLSGTADYELHGMFESPDDDRHRRDYRADPRLFALGHWKKRIFSATADQFFPFLQYAYGPLCLLPLLAESVLVVDEVHSFDKSMFSTLKRFLKEFATVPVLCMTATLPAERRRDLIEDCGLVPFPDTPPADLASIAKYPRYHIEWIESDQTKPLVDQALATRKRVLWVCNRVDDCRAAFSLFDNGGYIGPDDIPTYCYHSRFKLDDRRERHNDLVRGFQNAASDDSKSQAILGITTQVCEMSLDLDAEVLITELAPIASLIQRMGRCNRDSEKMKTRPPGRVYVLRPQPGKEKPYEPNELTAAERFVNDLVGGDVSQDKLEEVYKHCDIQDVEPDKLCPFLDSGPYAEAREESFRDADDFTVPCVLDYDVRKAKSAIARKEAVDGLVVPVPLLSYLANPPGPGSGLPSWLSVAPGYRYDRLSGFDGRPLPKPDGGCDT